MVARDPLAGHGEEHPGLGERAGRLRRRAGAIPATSSSATWTAWWWCRASAAAEVLKASQDRLAKEAKSRERLAKGELGLDFYGLRAKLAELGVQYVDGES